MGWFGSLGLVWKFFLVFALLIVLTFVAGGLKVLYNRRQLKKHIALKGKSNREETDQLALNDRQKDEGDLFGIRALEAGYYGGVAQSRPSSPTPSSMGSSRHPSVSTNTLIGSAASSTPKLISPATSVTHLPHSRNTSAGVASPKTPASPPRRNPPSMLRLEPSEAELNGRKNHGAVQITVERPSSPVEPRSPESPMTPKSQRSPRSPVHSEGLKSPAITVSAASDYDAPLSPEILRPSVYKPNAPQLPVVESVSRISWRPEGADDAAANAQSVAASLDYTMGAPSTRSNASSPARTPSPLPSPVKISPQPYIPRRSRDEPRSIWPAEPREHRRKGSMSSVWSRRTKPEEEEDTPAVPSLAPEADFVILQPTVYVPTHNRDVSVSASDYSTDSRRRSSLSSVETLTHETLPATKIGITRSDSTASRRHSIGANSLMPPPSPNPSSKDRFSDFFDAYYRHSQSMADSEQTTEIVRVDTLAIPRYSTIVEVPTPLGSPMPQKARMSARFSQPGTAL
ncbi:hypothetical protein GTA08_BOTSDO00611 [Neofusicoccum parvum]|uniref:Uncharacterized protein n=1 Tax=Neofusicoccum parvum TaxID=310453 RepID=A0ACB5SCZ0_9PEZI|nr:hypothetical protein GTA08_BOTSDO00611 [Neofusicoccum parvum]